jgi:hypothetical protein
MAALSVVVQPECGQDGRVTTAARSPLDRQGILDTPARLPVPGRAAETSGLFSRRRVADGASRPANIPDGRREMPLPPFATPPPRSSAGQTCVRCGHAGKYHRAPASCSFHLTWRQLWKRCPCGGYLPPGALSKTADQLRPIVSRLRRQLTDCLAACEDHSPHWPLAHAWSADAQPLLSGCPN